MMGRRSACTPSLSVFSVLSAPVSGIRSAFSLSIGRIVERVIGPALVVVAVLATADAQQPAADLILHRTVTYADRQTYIEVP